MLTHQHLQGQSLQVKLRAPRDTFSSLPGSDLIRKGPVLVDLILLNTCMFLWT